MSSDVIRLITFYFKLRIFRVRMMGIPFVIKVFTMYVNNYP